MDNLRELAAIFGFGAFLVGALLAVDAEGGPQGLLIAGAIVIAGLVIASAIDRSGTPARAERRPPGSPDRPGSIPIDPAAGG
jgi:hypothetical protein